MYVERTRNRLRGVRMESNDGELDSDMAKGIIDRNWRICEILRHTIPYT